MNDLQKESIAWISPRFYILEPWESPLFRKRMTFGLTYKGNIHDFLSDSAEIYETVLFKHFHTIYIDGVFYENSFGDEVFFEIVPTHAEVVQLNGTLKKRLTRLLEKFDHEDHDYNDQSDFQAQSVQNRLFYKLGNDLCDATLSNKPENQRWVDAWPEGDDALLMLQVECRNDYKNTQMCLFQDRLQSFYAEAIL